MLDVSVRASILNLLKDLVDELDMGALYISHDLSLIRQTYDRTSVMYLGKVVERGPTEQLIREHKHPRARALLDVVPVPNSQYTISEPQLEGEPPDPVELPEGRNFRPRCPFAAEKCFEEPGLDASQTPDGEHTAACWRVEMIDNI